MSDTQSIDNQLPPSQQDNHFMPHDARRVLVYIMRYGTVLATQNPKLFDLLCQHENAIRRHLSEVYLQLVLDEKNGVAFIASYSYENTVLDKQNESISAYDNNENDDFDAEEVTSLISKRTLTLYDTLILLMLRKHYQDRESAGEQKITISIERLESYLLPFLPITDHGTKERKKLIARVKEMVKRKLLSTIQGSEDRYEITPIIRYVVSASFLESILLEYEKLAAKQSNFEDQDGDFHE